MYEQDEISDDIEEIQPGKENRIIAVLDEE